MDAQGGLGKRTQVDALGSRRGTCEAKGVGGNLLDMGELLADQSHIVANGLGLGGVFVCEMNEMPHGLQGTANLVHQL